MIVFLYIVSGTNHILKMTEAEFRETGTAYWRGQAAFSSNLAYFTNQLFQFLSSLGRQSANCASVYSNWFCCMQL